MRPVSKALTPAMVAAMRSGLALGQTRVGLVRRRLVCPGSPTRLVFTPMGQQWHEQLQARSPFWQVLG